MGRKAGGKNFGNFNPEALANETKAKPKVKYIEVSQEERKALPEIFTSINKDFIGVQDLMAASGLSYDTCVRLIREIKAVSDVFGVSGYIHRTDYFLYLSRKFKSGVSNDERISNSAYRGYIGRDNDPIDGTDNDIHY